MKKVLILALCAGLLGACSQTEIDEAAVEEEADSVANDMFDDLNAGFEDEEPEETSAADSLADAAMNAVLDESE